MKKFSFKEKVLQMRAFKMSKKFENFKAKFSKVISSNEQLFNDLKAFAS